MLQKYLSYIIPISIVGYLLWSASLYSDNFEQTQMRLIDDYAMQYSIYNLQTNMLDLNFASVGYQFDYAYGWLFWIFFGVLTLPFRLALEKLDGTGPESLLIISVRGISVLILVLIVINLYRIVRKIYPNRLSRFNLVAFLFSICIMLSPAIGYWAGRPMPPLFAILLITYAILLAVVDYSAKSKRPFLVALILGLSVGVKINYAVFIPVVLLIIYLIKRESTKDHFVYLKVSNLTKLLTSFIVGFLLGLSPANLVNPLEAIPRTISTINLFRQLSVTERTQSLGEFWSNFESGIVASGFGLAVYVVFILLLLTLTLNKYIFSKEYDSSTTLLCLGFLVICLQIATSFFLGLGTIYVQSYSLPLVVFTPILIVLLLKTLKVNSQTFSIYSILIFLLMSVNFGTGIMEKDSILPRINTYQNAYQADLRSEQFKIQVLMQNQIVIGEGSVDIIQDFTLPTAWSGFRNGVNLTYSYDDWDTAFSTNPLNVLYVFIDKNQHGLSESNGSYLNSRSSNLSESSLGVRRILSTLIFGTRLCELNSESERYFLLKCDPV